MDHRTAAPGPHSGGVGGGSGVCRGGGGCGGGGGGVGSYLHSQQNKHVLVLPH